MSSLTCSNVCCLQDVGAPITPREEVIIPLYDVARPPPPGYDVENTHTSPEGEAAKDSSQGSKVMPTEGEGGGHEENIAAQVRAI